MSIHLTIGVYSDGSYKWNGVSSEYLAAHVNYNKTMRPGRALIVDWEIVHVGYLTEEKLNDFIQKHKPNWKMTKNDTTPYV
jgi:hypothetical protein